MDPPWIRAHMKASPPASAIALVKPLTETGALRWVVVVSPSCPLPLSPQHLTEPSVSIAQLELAVLAMRGRVDAPQKSVPPQPSAMLPEVMPWAAQVVGT